MSRALPIVVTEEVSLLKRLYSKADVPIRPRLKMLILLATGTPSVTLLSAKTGSHRDAILKWKKRYAAGGLDALLSDKRGGDKRSGITAEQKQKIADKLSDPGNGFRSYGEARAWLKEELGIEKQSTGLVSSRL
jgi:transposase